MTPTEAAAKWNAASEASPYSQADFTADTATLTAADADAYLRALNEPYKRFQAVNWDNAKFGVAYGALPEELRYNSEKVELPPPPPEEIAHHFDALPTGTIIEKTPDGFALHPQGTTVVQPPLTSAQSHTGGFNGFIHRVLHWLGLAK